MSDMVDIEAAGQAIADALGEYDQHVADVTKAIVDDVSKEAVEKLKKRSPKLTGDYRKNWRKRQAYADKRTKRNTVYNDNEYGLAHLLEYGHGYVDKDGRRRENVARAIPHIAPVEQEAIEALQERIEAAVSK